MGTQHQGEENPRLFSPTPVIYSEFDEAELILNSAVEDVLSEDLPSRTFASKDDDDDDDDLSDELQHLEESQKQMQEDLDVNLLPMNLSLESNVTCYFDSDEDDSYSSCQTSESENETNHNELSSPSASNLFSDASIITRTIHVTPPKEGTVRKLEELNNTLSPIPLESSPDQVKTVKNIASTKQIAHNTGEKSTDQVLQKEITFRQPQNYGSSFLPIVEEEPILETVLEEEDEPITRSPLVGEKKWKNKWKNAFNRGKTMSKRLVPKLPLAIKRKSAKKSTRADKKVGLSYDDHQSEMASSQSSASHERQDGTPRGYAHASFDSWQQNGEPCSKVKLSTQDDIDAKATVRRLLHMYVESTKKINKLQKSEVKLLQMLKDAWKEKMDMRHAHQKDAKSLQGQLDAAQQRCRELYKQNLELKMELETLKSRSDERRSKTSPASQNSPIVQQRARLTVGKENHVR